MKKIISCVLLLTSVHSFAGDFDGKWELNLGSDATPIFKLKCPQSVSISDLSVSFDSSQPQEFIVNDTQITNDSTVVENMYDGVAKIQVKENNVIQFVGRSLNIKLSIYKEAILKNAEDFENSFKENVQPLQQALGGLAATNAIQVNNGEAVEAVLEDREEAMENSFSSSFPIKQETQSCVYSKQ